jgi:hypothetical protein
MKGMALCLPLFSVWYAKCHWKRCGDAVVKEINRIPATLEE